MSRQPVKGRLERGKGAQSTPNPAVQHEIIPGKFTEHDWNLAVGPSENEEFVLGIVNEVVNAALGEIYEKYLLRQLIPFTVSLAKDAMLQIVEWNFLAHDVGEVPDRLSAEAWLEDSEPASATIDSWGQGCIPKTVLTPRSSRLGTPAPHEAIAEEDESPADDAISEVEDTVEAVAKTGAGGAKATGGPESEEALPPAPSGSNRFRFRPYRGKLKSAGLSAMSETLLETEQRLNALDESQGGAGANAERPGAGVPDMPASCLSILKVQAGRPPGNKEVIYDESGNVVSVVKIPADRLPMHRVNVGYRVLQAELEAEKARLEALKRGIRVPAAAATAAVPAGAGARRAAAGATAAAAAASMADPRLLQQPPGPAPPDPKVESLPPSLVETIDLAPGVSVREGGLLRSGPPAARNGNERFAEIHLKGLRPVQARLAAGDPARVTAGDLLPAGRIAVRPPINGRRPIPPIQSTAH